MSTARDAKAIGTEIEQQVTAIDELDRVGDDVAEWYDAVTTAVLEPRIGLRFGGICLLERGTPVEIKGTSLKQSNGTDDIAGRWYVKRDAHERLVDERGAYWLAVYRGDPSAVLYQMIVPAATIGDLLVGSWYDSQRPEGDVAKLSWKKLFGRLSDPQGVGDNAGE